ncbi:MFS transporter [Candidatus Pacearchaeota archaeon]|nr:MFS transporter [Candidatus Pacearchaeota archaeon]
MQYNQLYATALGANPIELGTLNSLSRLASSTISLFTGWIADRYSVKMVLLLLLGLTTVFTAIYSIADHWVMLIPAIILSGASMRVLPFTDVFLINLAKLKQRAMVISVSRALWAIIRIFAPMVAAIIVTHFGGLNAEGIRPLYYVQLVLAILVFISIVVWLKAPKDSPVEKTMEPVRKKGGGIIQDFRDLFKGERWLKRWLILFAIRSSSMGLATSFVSLWVVNVKEADPYILGVMGTASMITSMILQIPVARLSDKIGRKRAYYILRPFTFLGTILLIMAPNPQYLILVGILGSVGITGQGGIGGVSFIPFITMEHEMVPAEKRGRWQGLLGTFGLLSFPASILGGIMWQQGLMIEVILIPILLEVLTIMPILSTIPDTLGRSKL